MCAGTTVILNVLREGTFVPLSVLQVGGRPEPDVLKQPRTCVHCVLGCSQQHIAELPQWILPTIEQDWEDEIKIECWTARVANRMTALRLTAQIVVCESWCRHTIITSYFTSLLNANVVAGCKRLLLIDSRWNYMFTAWMNIRLKYIGFYVLFKSFVIFAKYTQLWIVSNRNN